MSGPPGEGGVYDHPRWWDLAFADETEGELTFVRRLASERLGVRRPSTYEPGCGGGRLVVAAAAAGLAVQACDLNGRCVDHARGLLRTAGLSADVRVADMRTHVAASPVDVAVCPVNTFRHLLTEDDAAAHLAAVGESVRPGGRYVLGLHLAPPDTDPEDEEEWSAESPDGRVDARLVVTSFSRARRRERLRFTLAVTPAAGGPFRVAEEFDYRLYTAAELRRTVEASGRWRIESVHDFWYDLDEPLELDDGLGDTVLVLERV